MINNRRPEEDHGRPLPLLWSRTAKACGIRIHILKAQSSLNVSSDYLVSLPFFYTVFISVFLILVDKPSIAMNKIKWFVFATDIVFFVWDIN